MIPHPESDGEDLENIERVEYFANEYARRRLLGNINFALAKLHALEGT